MRRVPSSAHSALVLPCERRQSPVLIGCRLGCVLLAVASSACSDGAGDSMSSRVPQTTVAVEITVAVVAPSTASEPVISLPVTTILVGDEVGPPLVGDVLRTAAVGDGPDEIGLDPGPGEGSGPWSPIVVGDTVIVLDQANRRWISMREDGTTMTDEVEPGSVSAGQPLLAPDGFIYAPFRVDNAPAPDGTPTWVVRSFDPEHLADETLEIPIRGSMYTTTEVVGDQLVVNGTAVHRLATGDAVTVDIRVNTVIIESATMRTAWTLPEGWDLGQPHVLSDGSVVVRGSSGKLVVLGADGTWATRTTTGVNYGNDGDITIDDDGVVQIERVDDTWHIVRYPLPTN